jgi:quercetin dioxygenase-like cupin family protein
MKDARQSAPGIAAYPLPQPAGMAADLVHAGAISAWCEDDELWVPQSEGVAMKPLLLNASQGYYINLLRVRRAGVLSCHRHSGPVHALVLKGRWHDQEHDGVATQGDYAFEPAGVTHTLFVPEDVPEMITWFHVTGGYTYVDAQGRATGYEDVFTKIEYCRRHYETIGLGADHVKRYMR